MSTIEPWHLHDLVCPVDRTPLTDRDGALVSEAGRVYPVVDGIPVMLVDDARQTIGLARASLDRAHGRPGAADPRAPDLYLESVGVEEPQKQRLLELAARPGPGGLDPVALVLVAATSGYAYEHLIGDESLAEYPIPEISLPAGQGRSLLDVGCSWGRWTIAAQKKGYQATGLDPSLGAVMAARRISRQMGLPARFVVGDGRHLPFRDGLFDTVYSYSVLQHFSKDDARTALRIMSRVLKPGGRARIQMAAKFGIRSLQHQAARRFREPDGFEVRYWSVPELRQAFESAIGPTRTSVDCFFGLGWQWSDFRHMSARLKPVLVASEVLRRASLALWPMTLVADSVFCEAVAARAA